MRTRVIKSFFLLLAVFLPGFTTQACSCASSAFTKADFDGNDFIFIGQVVRFEDDPQTTDGKHTAWFKPYKIYKGKTDANGLIALSCYPQSPCGSSFSENTSYFICSYGHISLCDWYERLPIEADAANFQQKMDTVISRFHANGWLDSWAALAKENGGSLEKFYSSGKYNAQHQKEGRWDYYDEVNKYFMPAGDTTPAPKLIRISVFYTKGETDSIYSYHSTRHPEGQRLEEIDRYKDGKEYGWQENFHSNGKLAGKYFVEGDEKTSVTFQYNEKGIMWSKYYMQDSMYVSESYDEEEGFLLMRIVTPPHGKELVKLYRKDGSVYMEGHTQKEQTYIRMDNMLYIDYYRNTKGEEVVKNGHGHITEWFDATHRDFEIDVKNGIFYGTYKAWYPSGKIMTERFFQETSEQHDFFNAIIEQVSSSYYCKYGVAYGTHTDYWDDGEKRKESIYRKGDKIIHVKHYNRDGLLVSEFDHEGNPSIR